VTIQRVGVTSTDTLDDLYSLFSDIKAGETLETDIESDPDEDLEDAADEVVYQDDDVTLKDLNPVASLHVLKDTFGDEWWKLEHDALVDTLTDGAGLPESDRDLIRSLQLLYTDESFWTEWEIFNWVTKGLTDEPVDFETLGVLDVTEMLSSMLIADLVAKDQKMVAHYSPEVLSYIAVTCLEEGVWAVPAPLAVAQKRIEELMQMRGWHSLPLARVRALAYSRQPLPPTGDINTQARRYRALISARATLLREAEAEIATYEKMSDGRNNQ